MTATVQNDRVTAILEKFGALIGHATELDPSDRNDLRFLAAQYLRDGMPEADILDMLRWHLSR